MTLALCSMTASANLETLIMPGKVIEGHAEYETECTRCHTRFGKQTQRQLCLDCHDDIAADITAKEGFHSHIPDSNNVDCKTCHGEHRGRQADIVQFNPLTFDHNQTDFELRHAHRQQPCSACHARDKKYREASADCFSCHEKKDVHRGKLGEACGDCHDSQGWKNTRFDHDDTDFPLAGQHRDVACASCHINNQYQETPASCNSCHAINDVHAGRFGKQCDDCHSTNKWTEIDFDHDRETDFPLKNAHRKPGCNACHSIDDKPTRQVRTCYSCHRNEDVHLGRNGKECDSCHGTRKWSNTSFDHKDTDFPLRGEHESLACTACHSGDVYQDKLDSACIGCHRDDDTHNNQLGDNCQRCHRESGWGEQVVFDHDLARLPLIGLHATLSCESCHLSGEFRDAPLACVDCHEADDTHKQTLGPNCNQCHNPNGWNYWRFDHNQQTDFELKGKHDGLACKSCHRTPVKDSIALPNNCNGCHQQDDVHRGRFGQNCQRCHNERNFREVRMPR